VRRTCPVCVLREAGIVAEDCVVCGGHGTVELGERALAYFTPEAVSTAVHLALESQARALHDSTTRQDDPRPAVEATMGRLAKAGIVVVRPKAPAPDPGPPGRTRGRRRR